MSDYLKVEVAELDDVPKALIRQMSLKTLREYVCVLRGERNDFKNLYQQAKAKLDDTEEKLERARYGCRKLKETLERIRKNG